MNTMEHNKEQFDTLKKNILEKIQKNELLMRPKRQFILKIAAVAFLVFITFILSVFICNFIFFHIIESGRGALLTFGPRGYLSFLQFFPWTLLFIDIGLIILLQYTLRTFEFGYKRPGIYLATGILGVIVVSGILVSQQTPFNRILSEEATLGHLPMPIRDFYNQALQPPPAGRGICRCEVISIDDDTLLLKDTDGDGTVLTIILSDAMPHDFEVGTTVFVAGDVRDNKLNAFGIQKMGRPHFPHRENRQPKKQD